MKCFIIAAVTADGYIAKETNHAAFWTSKEDKKRFVEITKRAGVVVMGLTTFKTLGRPLPKRLNMIYSPEPLGDIAKPKDGNIETVVETTTDTPHDLLLKLEARGFKEVAICGGASIYNMFMKSGLVDSLYLTIEPIIFGKGIRLFNDDMHHQLTLKSCEKTDGGSLLLEYSVNFSNAPTGATLIEK